jgi:hypothetical protein
MDTILSLFYSTAVLKSYQKSKLIPYPHNLEYHNLYFLLLLLSLIALVSALVSDVPSGPSLDPTPHYAN